MKEYTIKGSISRKPAALKTDGDDTHSFPEDAKIVYDFLFSEVPIYTLKELKKILNKKSIWKEMKDEGSNKG